jgi:hypothetical protein
MVKLTVKTVSIIARLGNTSIQVGPHRREGQHIVVRVDVLTKVFRIRFFTYKEPLERLWWGCQWGQCHFTLRTTQCKLLIGVRT